MTTRWMRRSADSVSYLSLDVTPVPHAAPTGVYSDLFFSKQRPTTVGENSFVTSAGTSVLVISLNSNAIVPLGETVASKYP